MDAQPDTSVAAASVLSVRHLTKSFGGLKAINDVTFEPYENKKKHNIQVGREGVACFG